MLKLFMHYRRQLTGPSMSLFPPLLVPKGTQLLKGGWDLVCLQWDSLERGEGSNMVLQKTFMGKLQLHACYVLCVLLRLLHQKLGRAGV